MIEDRPKIPKTSPKPKKRDLLEMLGKGLIPLAALDIIRGWMVLEATSSTEYDTSLIKASTQNKLGYQEIRSALLSMKIVAVICLLMDLVPSSPKGYHAGR